MSKAEVDYKAELDAAAVRFAARVKARLADREVDPFEGLPSPQRATCDGDWVL